MSSLIDRISSDLQLKNEYIRSIVRRSNYYYKDYYISKRNGGQRKISQASPELKTLQYWIKANILALMPVSKGAFAYRQSVARCRLFCLCRERTTNELPCAKAFVHGKTFIQCKGAKAGG